MKQETTRKYLALLLILLLSVPYCFGQREKNNIYLFDCTGSMKTNQLWEPAREALNATISTQTSIPGSHFYVIPFGDNPYQTIEFNSADYGGCKDDMEKAFRKYVSEAKYTHISDVLKAGFAKTDQNKENKIYLLTDGMPNGGDSQEKVAAVIREWCGNHKNCRLFYVALTNGVISPTIRQAIDECEDAFIVQCEGKVIPQIVDISPNEIYTNLEELGAPREVTFSIPGRYKLDVASTDSLFNVRVADNSAVNGKIKIRLSPKNGQDAAGLHQMFQGGRHSFDIKLQCADKKYFIANPIVRVNVADEVPSKLSIAQGEEELKADGAKWYDSFLWSDAAPDKKIRWDLAPAFKNELRNSSLDLTFGTNEDDEADYQAWFNGEPVKAGGSIRIEPGRPAVLEVMFNHDAKTGKRYFTLTPKAVEGLDFINDQPAAEYEGTSLRTEYAVGWNPLKTLLFWLGVVILGLLLLWLLILKRIFFPSIKMGKVAFTGPGTYYVSKKIKGARKVVLTSRRKSQNIVSRLFTGEIRYIKADFFTSELAILPVGNKKKVKLTTESGVNNTWDIYPSSIFAQYDKGTIENRNTKEKSEIDFS